MNTRRIIYRFGVALVISFCLFYLLTLSRLDNCSDCFRPHGFLFTYFHEGGFMGGSAWIWTGVIVDLLCVFVSAMIITWIWKWRDSEANK